MAKKSKKAAKKPESKFEAFESSLDDALKIKKDGNPGKHADISEAVGVLEQICAEVGQSVGCGIREGLESPPTL